MLLIDRSTNMMRLEQENNHLMNVVENLRTSTPDSRARQLEEENRTLSESMLEYKTTISKLTKVSVVVGAAIIAVVVTLALILSV